MIYSNSEIFFFFNFCLFSKFVILPLISCSPGVMNSGKTNHKTKKCLCTWKEPSQLGAGRCGLLLPSRPGLRMKVCEQEDQQRFSEERGWESCLRALIHHQELWTRHRPHAFPKSQPCETCTIISMEHFEERDLEKLRHELEILKEKIRHTMVELRLTLPSRGLLTSTQCYQKTGREKDQKKRIWDVAEVEKSEAEA